MDKFKTSLREVLLYIKYSKDKKKLEDNPQFQDSGRKGSHSNQELDGFPDNKETETISGYFPHQLFTAGRRSRKNAGKKMSETVK